jgi:hypothetical protein
MMTLETFRATKREIAIGDSAMPQDVMDAIEFEVDEFESALLYWGDCWIMKRKNGMFWFMLGRDEFESADISELESELFSWAESEGYFE